MVQRNCTCQINCSPYVLASKTVNRNTDPVMDLTPYQGPGHNYPLNKWRLIETGYHLVYYSGDIDCDGKLVGLPSQFVSNYYYNGYMQLQVGCVQENGSVTWP